MHSQIEKLLTSALLEAAELDYCSDIPSDEELKILVTPSKKFERKMAKMLKSPDTYIRNIRRPLHARMLRTAAMIALTVALCWVLSCSTR